MSATRKALRTVAIMVPPLGLDDLAAAAGRLDPLASGLREAVRVDRELLRQLAAAEHLDGHVAAGAETGGAQRLEVDGRAVLEPALEIEQVDRLRVRAERLERHRHLLVRAAQLAH